jgi:hypothetical protein
MPRSVSLLRTVDEEGTTKWYVDGRRVTRNRHDEIRQAAELVDSFLTTKRGNRFHHHSRARIAGSSHLITLRDPSGIVHREDFDGTDAEAEKRFGDVWNERAAHLPDAGLIATLERRGDSRPFQTIGL